MAREPDTLYPDIEIPIDPVIHWDAVTDCVNPSELHVPTPP
jgi:hypothetical protein